MMPHECSFLSEWMGTSSGSHSPASSTESYLLSPNYPHTAMHNETFANYFHDPVINMACRHTEKSPPNTRRPRCKIIGPQRQSASEREKMRMRNLSKALHNLRKYLPPSIVPAGRNLTKIETLRLTIDYISYLSKLLGLNEETLKQRGQSHQNMDDAYLKVPEGCQEMTCRQYQLSQPQSQSSFCYEVPQQREGFRVSAGQHMHTQMQEEPQMSFSLHDRSQRAITNFSLSSSYSSRCTHLYQVPEAESPGGYPSQLPYIRESDCLLRNSEPHMTFINSMPAS